MRRFLKLAAPFAALIVIGCGGSTSHPSAAPQPVTSQTAGGSVHPPGWGQQHAPASRQLLLAPSATMYDSITLATVPPGPFALAGYTSGFWPTYLPMRQQWPGAHTVSIAVTAAHHADCLDIEPGDATPSRAAGWVRADIQAGFPKPCLYSSYFEFVTEVRPALARAGITRQQVWEWDADYTFRAHIDAGFDGTQWTDVAFGRNLDASTVTRAFLSIAQPPLSPPKPGPTPKQRRELAAAYRLRSELRRDLAQHGGSNGPATPKSYAKVWKRWVSEGRAVNAAIQRLHAEGVR